MKDIEAHKDKILLDKEEEQRIKSRATSVVSRDKSTKKIHNFVDYRKKKNLIWELRDEDSREVQSFQGLTDLSVRHFRGLF